MFVFILQNMQGLPVPAWPNETPEEIPITASQPPIEDQHEEPAIEDQHAEPVIEAEAEPNEPQHEVAPVIRRQSERIKQILFNKPPPPGPGLTPDDAMVLE